MQLNFSEDPYMQNCKSYIDSNRKFSTNKSSTQFPISKIKLPQN